MCCKKPCHFLGMMTSSNGNNFRVTGPLFGEFTGPGEFPTQRPVTRSFDVFFDLRSNIRLSKQPWGWWFETPSWSLWRHYNMPTINCNCSFSRCRNKFVSMNKTWSGNNKTNYFWSNENHNERVACKTLGFTFVGCGRMKMAVLLPWWRHEIETFSALLTLGAGNSPVNDEVPHKGQWRGALMFSLTCAWTNG